MTLLSSGSALEIQYKDSLTFPHCPSLLLWETLTRGLKAFVSQLPSPLQLSPVATFCTVSRWFTVFTPRRISASKFLSSRMSTLNDCSKSDGEPLQHARISPRDVSWFCTAFSVLLTLVMVFQGNLYRSLTGFPFHLRCLLCVDYFEWRHACAVCEITEYCFGWTVVVGQWSWWARWIDCVISLGKRKTSKGYSKSDVVNDGELWKKA